MSFHLSLSQPLADSGLDLFRILWRLIFLPWRNRPKKTLIFRVLACDAQKHLQGEVTKTSDSLSSSSWTAEKPVDHPGSAILDRTGKQIAVWLGGTSIMHTGLLDAALGDLDGAAFVSTVNERLAPLINGIVITANTYCVAAIPSDRVRVSEGRVEEALPLRFSGDDLSEPWLRVGTESVPAYFDFSHHTPERLASTKVVDISSLAT